MALQDTASVESVYCTRRGEAEALLQKGIQKPDGDIAKMKTKLINPKFRDNAPAEILGKVQAELEEAVAKRTDFMASMEKLKKLSDIQIFELSINGMVRSVL